MCLLGSNESVYYEPDKLPNHQGYPYVLLSYEDTQLSGMQVNTFLYVVLKLWNVYLK